MKRAPATTVASVATLALAALLAVLLLATPAAYGEEVTRESFVAQAEPICEQNTLRIKKALEGAQEKINDDRLPSAGRQFFRASIAFGKGVQELGTIPRPPADDVRILKWFKFLRIVKTRMVDIGKALKEDDRIKANHESIRAEKSGNAANNVSFVFGFDECRMSRSQFR